MAQFLDFPPGGGLPGSRPVDRRRLAVEEKQCGIEHPLFWPARCRRFKYRGMSEEIPLPLRLAGLREPCGSQCLCGIEGQPAAYRGGMATRGVWGARGAGTCLLYSVAKTHPVRKTDISICSAGIRRRSTRFPRAGVSGESRVCWPTVGNGHPASWSLSRVSNLFLYWVIPLTFSIASTTCSRAARRAPVAHASRILPELVSVSLSIRLRRIPLRH